MAQDDIHIIIYKLLAGSHNLDYQVFGNLRESNGFQVEFRKRSLNERDRRADSVINGIRYEFKSPEGAGYLAVHNQIKKNLYGTGKSKILNPQANRVVVSNIRSTLYFEDLVKQANDVMSGKTLFSEEELSCIEEIMVLDRDGRTMRVKR